MKHRSLTVLIALFISIAVYAQKATTDRCWYLAGEAMTVNVDVADARIAYAELCDAHSLITGTLISLTNGQGSAHIELPLTMHSGYYMLSVYSRGGNKVWQCLVPVVNALYANEDDDIIWQPTTATASYVPETHPQTISRSVTATTNPAFAIPEAEGHIVIAKIKNNGIYRADEIKASLSVVGKQVHYFEGKMTNDTTAVFFTNGVLGRQPIVVAAYNIAETALPIEIVSPFETILPDTLPHLTFSFLREEVEQRSREMQLHQIAITPEKKETTIGEETPDASTIEAEPMPYDDRIYSRKPSLSYNLDHYRQFATIRETLLEYVRDVHRMSFKGVSQLAVYNDQEGYASWAAMVFIDGMPVHDIDRLLAYDARRLHYINIYEDRYTFGRYMYKGIVSFVTRSGRLTNYPTEPNVSYLVYDFPSPHNP